MVKYITIFALLLLSTSIIGKKYSFEQLLEIALKKDPRDIEFQHRYEIMETELDKIYSIFYPKFKWTFGAAPMGAVDNDTPAQGSLSDMDFTEWGVGIKSSMTLTQPLFTFGKWSTGIDMGKKGLKIAKKKGKELKLQIKRDLLKAYNTLILLNQIESVIKDGESHLKKARKYLDKLNEEDSDDFNPNDLFRVKIYEQKLNDEKAALKKLQKTVRYGLKTLLNLEGDFTIKDKTLKKDSKLDKFNIDNNIKFSMLKDMIEIDNMKLSLTKLNFLPDFAIVASWSYKYSNVAEKQEGYDPYHGNSGTVALVLNWKLDPALLHSKYKKAKLTLLRDKSRVQSLKTINEIKNNQYIEELNYLEQKIDSQKIILKESKKWFLGVAMDYYMGLEKSKTLLETLTDYKKAKIDRYQAIYNYNNKLNDWKLFLGEL